MGEIMRELFNMDMKNYKEKIETSFSRPSVRGIYIKDNKLWMIYSNKYDYYKFPGGGIDNNESFEDALVREIQEEAGLVIDPVSIKEWGHVLVKERGSEEDLFIQDNYYFFYDILSSNAYRNLDNYEKEEGYELRFVSSQIALDTNMNHYHLGYSDKTQLLREINAINLLIKEGHIK
ncbi:MAG: NUDIX domain-containing protein [Acholeplasmatales bacterium]|nr:NUDIX domain-containing protein [Acholeplasmatales bacterium]